MPAVRSPSIRAASSAVSPTGPGVLMMSSEKSPRWMKSRICNTGGKHSFCSSYSGSSNSPMGWKLTSGIPVSVLLSRLVMTVSESPFSAVAAVIRRIVVATPFTSSSVSVNHARFVLRSAGAGSPMSDWQSSPSHARSGAICRNARKYGLSESATGASIATSWMASKSFPPLSFFTNEVKN